MTSLVPLVDASRGGTLECRFFGAVAVADTQGRVVAHAGDPHWVTFTRSTLKALQALPFVEGGGPQALGFTDRQLALLCASHSGEPMHVEQVQAMLDRIGLSSEDLQCGCHVPYYVDATGAKPPAQVDARHHNCSGKHTGMLAWCVQHGAPTGTYLDEGHPLQLAIRRHVARATGLEESALRTGTDGCSAPNYAMPLSALARAYARLATADRDPEFGASFAQLAGAMRAHPELVSGTNRFDDAVMRAGRGDLVSKAGADGVQAIGSAARGEALVVKVSDGNKTAVTAAAVEAMDQLGWLDDAQREQLRPWRAQEITNWRGTVVGERQAVFRLQPAG
jgi:L-asparaginase II